MIVSFVVKDWDCPTGTTRTVAWAEATDVEPVPALKNVATATGVAYNEDGESLCLFDAELSGLKSNVRYYYRPEGGAETFSFVADPMRAGGNTYALLADFGIENDLSGE